MKKSLSLLTFAREFSVAAPVNGLVAPQQEKREAEEKPSQIPRVQNKRFSLYPDCCIAVTPSVLQKKEVGKTNPPLLSS